MKTLVGMVVVQNQEVRRSINDGIPLYTAYIRQIDAQCEGKVFVASFIMNTVL